MDLLYRKLKEFGTVKTNEPLAKHTTFKIGGLARFFVVVEKSFQLAGLLNFLAAEDIDYFIMGGGSNLLFNEQPYDGVVVQIATRDVPVVKQKQNHYLLEADGGVDLQIVVNHAAQHVLSGMEWAVGIPGSVGGAVRGNAGAMGGDMAHSLAWVRIWRDGEIIDLPPSACHFRYRDSIFKRSKDIVLRAAFALRPGNRTDMLAAMKKYLEQRALRGPDYPSAGSFFKNIKLELWPGDHEALPELFRQRGTVPVGWLAEQVGVKGLARGGAKVSDYHGNVIMNVNHATQEDILYLVEEIKNRIYNKFGVMLEPEVQIVHF